ncbi:hypothetical protein TSOC_004238 [Tetrabaena socialis]|uniref:Uncharacterized protein n=1 Tax=Tetrabaena socialis TaxID=47790 RepID=A0A2J8A9J8_9CHLO|nr:hypothetical protein TSOC_004238 [Tetrabaena socialis]|eukprot:PNH09196.1 hypothetical protein TSOC_004238 [Tetrabaena socialis]
MDHAHSDPEGAPLMSPAAPGLFSLRDVGAWCRAAGLATITRHPYSTPRVIYAAFHRDRPDLGLYVGHTSLALMARIQSHTQKTAQELRKGLRVPWFHRALLATGLSKVIFFPLDRIPALAGQQGRAVTDCYEAHEMLWLHRLRTFPPLHGTGLNTVYECNFMAMDPDLRLPDMIRAAPPRFGGPPARRRWFAYHCAHRRLHFLEGRFEDNGGNLPDDVVTQYAPRVLHSLYAHAVFYPPFELGLTSDFVSWFIRAAQHHLVAAQVGKPKSGKPDFNEYLWLPHAARQYIPLGALYSLLRSPDLLRTLPDGTSFVPRIFWTKALPLHTAFSNYASFARNTTLVELMAIINAPTCACAAAPAGCRHQATQHVMTTSPYELLPGGR